MNPQYLRQLRQKAHFKFGEYQFASLMSKTEGNQDLASEARQEYETANFTFLIAFYMYKQDQQQKKSKTSS